MDLRPLWQPVGPLPASTYWWRRAVIALLLLAVALITTVAASGGGGATPKKVIAPPTTPAPHRTPAPPRGTPTTRAAAIPMCADRDLSVVAGTDANSYPTGVEPRFAITVKNVSSHACRRDIGSDARGYTVLSGSDRVWSTDDCNAGASASVVTLHPGQPVLFHRVWDRRRSKPGCPTGEPTALAGTYRLYVHIGPAVSGPVVFVLR